MSKAIKDLTDDELKLEWIMWDDEIKSATHWGAALAAANEFKIECERELRRRGIWKKEL